MILYRSVFNFFIINPNIRYLSNRPEHYRLKQNLKNSKEKECIICYKKLPVYLLECAHIKPRVLASEEERNDYNIVNWMCRICHKMYDRGDIGVNNKKIVINNNILNYTDLKLDELSTIKEKHYLKSKNYFDYHFIHIFCKK